MDGPKVLGIETLADSGQVVRVVAETRPSKRFDTERVLRERITRRLADRDITVPSPSAAPRVSPPTAS
jgi:small-conductance mechanosensitive channel